MDSTVVSIKIPMHTWTRLADLAQRRKCPVERLVLVAFLDGVEGMVR